MAEVKAQLNSLRLAPRKVRLLVDLVRGKNALVALDQLSALVRRPTDPLVKLIKSAIANGENSYQMLPSNLYIKEFFVDEGVKLKRYRPKGFGRAGEIQKKTSHISLVLAEKVPGLKTEKKEKPKSQTHTHDHDAHPPVKAKSDTSVSKTGKPEVKTELGKKDTTKSRNVFRRIFQRKQV